MFKDRLPAIPASSALREIPVKDLVPADPPILPSPNDRSPDAERLRALSDSIRLRGVRIPLIVSPVQPQPLPPDNPAPFRILAGERRFAAARMAGLTRVPCVVIGPVSAGELPDPPRPIPPNGECAVSAVSAVSENLRAGDLNLFESASAVSALIAVTGYTQEQCAEKLGVSQSFVANKLRLLRLTDEERRKMLSGRLTERHGRALLRFPTPEERAPVLDAMLRREMNVAAAEEYVESLLCADARAAVRKTLGAPSERPDSPPPDRRLIQRESRRFTDSIEKAVDVIRRSGIPVEARRKETPAGMLISILLPKSS